MALFQQTTKISQQIGKRTVRGKDFADSHSHSINTLQFIDSLANRFSASKSTEATSVPVAIQNGSKWALV